MTAGPRPGSARRQAQAPNSAVLRTKLTLARGRLRSAVERIWRHPDLTGMFLAYLVETHQIVRASVPLMRAARRRSLAMAGADPVCAPLARYFARHISQERDHDQWTLDDLEAVGIARAWVIGQMPPPEVAAMVGSQYYWIDHHHPISLLGYIAVLEGYSSSTEMVEKLRAASGLPRAVFRTYELHVREDPGHSQDLYALLDSMSLSRRHHQAIGLSALHTVQQLGACLDGLEPMARPTGQNSSRSFGESGKRGRRAAPARSTRRRDHDTSASSGTTGRGR